MSQDISGQGLEINITASNTFPSGFVISQFADDADPLDIADIQIAETAMGLNGDLVSWNTANPIPMTTNIIPGSDDDINLGILAEANRVGRGKVSSKDKITMNIVYPDGRIITLTDGRITNAPTTDSVASAGRKKSKTYAFAFENKTGGS
jgi:hypothetical protein